MHKKVLVDEKGKKYLWSHGDFHTKDGTIAERSIKKNSHHTTNKGLQYLSFTATFPDQLKKLKRGPAVMLPKDIGVILARTGINPLSKVVEAGSGSGFLTAHLANITTRLVSYEKNEDWHNITRENLKFLGLKARLKKKDITSGIDEKNVDVIILDMEDPTRVVNHAHTALKSGGFLVCYSPHIPQVQALVREAEKKFYHQATLEAIQREWIIEEQRVRPEHMGLLHTGFLTFLRKV